MDSTNPQYGNFSIVNNAPAQNNSGSGNTNTQTVNWSSSAASVSAAVSTSAEEIAGFGQLQDDGCFPSKFKPKINVESTADLELSFSSQNQPKAYALIINVFHYKPRYDKKKRLIDPTRHGSQRDVENLVQKFKLLNVGVYTPKTHTVKENTVIYVGASDINKWITDFKAKVGEHKRTSIDNKMACFVCIMGHGTADGRLVDSRDKEQIFIEKDIFRQFNNEYFPQMTNNPKIFFTNCCRGNDDSVRVTLTTDSGSGGSPQTLPNLSDVLIGWSTAPEHFSIRDVNAGSIFIGKLCAILQIHHDELILEYGRNKKNAEQTDIETILKAVVAKMRQMTYKDENGIVHSQTPSIENRSFGRFLWHKDDFEYSQSLPSYLLK